MAFGTKTKSFLIKCRRVWHTLKSQVEKSLNKLQKFLQWPRNDSCRRCLEASQGCSTRWFLQRKITVLCEDLKYIMKTAPRKKPYREDSVENQELKGELVQLQAQLRKFKEEVLPS